MIRSNALRPQHFSSTSFRLGSLALIGLALILSACRLETPTEQSLAAAVPSPSVSPTALDTPAPTASHTLAPTSTHAPTATAVPTQTASATATATHTAAATPARAATITPALPSTPPGTGSEEDYAVYSAVINANAYGSIAGGLVLIRDQTIPWSMFSVISFTVEYFAKNSPEVSRALVDNFRAANRAPINLTNRFDVKYKYEMLDEKTAAEIFSGPSEAGWRRFYERYPGSSGEVYLSRVGFNADRNQALVILGVQWAPLAGGGVMHWLEKQSGAWQVLKATIVWVV